MKRAESLWASFGYAFAGLGYAFKTQRNFRIHTAVALIVIGLGVWLGLSALEWAVMTLMIALVLAAELLNTMGEAAIDLVTEEHHQLAKVSKDLGAAAVLTTAVSAVVVGVLLLGPPMVRKLSGG